MSLNTITSKLHQFAVFFGNATRSAVQILVWATIAAASLAAVSVAFRAIWHAV